jgi:hypothetical protein
MGGGGGGGKGGGGSMPAMTPIEWPEQTPYVDTAALKIEKANAQKALLAMKGRQSTILTPDTLGDTSVGLRKTLSGAA